LLLALEERPYRESAEILGISETNVATKLNRLKQRIRQGIVVYTAAATTEKQLVEKGEN
jgi:DNA-binding CsgD family transcriptional regulator